jgi:hypothetical protein
MSVFSLLQLWIYDLYKAMRSRAAGIQPLKVVSRPHQLPVTLQMRVILSLCVLLCSVTNFALQLWIYDLYKAMRSGAAGIQPLKVVSRPPGFNWGGNNNAAEDASSPAPAPASANAPAPAAGGRWFEALRFPFGRRLQGQQEQARLLQAQRFPCARSKVTF